MREEKDFNGFSYKEHHHKKHQMGKIEDANRDYPMPKNNFKISQNLPNFGQSSTQLQTLKSITLHTMQNRLSSLFSILQTKVLTRFDSAFRQLKQAQEPHFPAFIAKRAIAMASQSFFEKVSRVFIIQALKNQFIFIQNIKILFGRSRNENSKRQMLRINSKIGPENQDFDADRNYSNEVTSTGEKTNKHLKKKKEGWDKEFNLFKNQMEQLLTQHQNYLKKH